MVSQYLGDLETQCVFSIGLMTKREVTLTKQEQAVSFGSMLESISMVYENMSEQEKEDIMSLYILSCDPDPVDTGEPMVRMRIKDFMLGYMVGKFMANTKSTLSSRLTSPEDPFSDLDL